MKQGDLGQEERVFINKDEENKELRLKLLNGRPFRAILKKQPAGYVMTTVTVVEEYIQYIYDLLLEIKRDTLHPKVNMVATTILLDLEMVVPYKWGDNDILYDLTPNSLKSIYLLLSAKLQQMTENKMDMQTCTEKVIKGESQSKLLSHYPLPVVSSYEIKRGLRTIKVDEAAIATLAYLLQAILLGLADIIEQKELFEPHREDVYQQIIKDKERHDKAQERNN